ncbi:hypothetical protein GP486_005883 [Trichoglossum hirsutum]|uniref:FAS1 domain-containing protein n=1 Tax=Trichoglossum hirsutum TaxID=265104 RepID=A0A9P8RLT4_9PEZI|nr:hypothetical protein GP486_005883 [Trichoglossum hirsutum]
MCLTLTLFSLLLFATSILAQTPGATSASTSALPLCSKLAALKATDFAKLLESGNECNSSNKARTVFAPHDDGTNNKRAQTLALLLSRQNALSSKSLYQLSPELKTAAILRGRTGGIVETLDIVDANIGGRAQSVLSHGNSTCNVPPAPIQLFSGLGNSVTIIEEDIPFAGGIIHIVSGYFTIPELLSTTLLSTAETTAFSSIASTTYDTTPSITVFAPNNAAVVSILQNRTLPASEIASLLNAHVISGFVAYSPLLVDGAKFRTMNGTDVTISVKPDGDILVNEDTKVVRTDLIVTNGVVHIIDKVLFTPPSATVKPSAPLATFTGAAGLTAVGQTGGWFGGVMWGIFMASAVSVVSVVF